MKEELKRKKSSQTIFSRFYLKYKKVPWIRDFQRKDAKEEKIHNQKLIKKT